MRSERDVPFVAWLRRLADELGNFQIELGTEKAGVGHFSDAVALIKSDSGLWIRLLIELKLQLTPRMAIAFLATRPEIPDNSVLLLCCPFLSVRVMEMCRESEVGYLDAVGNCHLEGRGVFVHIEGRPNPSSDEKTRGDPFAEKSSRVVRALLSHPGREWLVQELADETEVSIGLASRVKTVLLEEGFINTKGRLLKLHEPEKLLQAWSEHYEPPVEKLAFYTSTRAREAEVALARWCEQQGIICALTQFSGASRVAPMVRSERGTLCVQRNPSDSWSIEQLIGSVGGRLVETGANLSLWISRGAWIFYGRRFVQDVPIVSPIQLYLDLRRSSARGEEAAQEVLEREILPTFRTDTPYERHRSLKSRPAGSHDRPGE